MTINQISGNKFFKSTSLYKEFIKEPVGFIDIGSAGGVHPLILPIASISRVMCFEPDKKEAKKIITATESNLFAEFVVQNTAISGKKKKAAFHITKGKVTSSLLKPSREITVRYPSTGINIDRIETIETQSIDDVLYQKTKPHRFAAEIIKLDCQGTSYDVIKGAAKALQSQAVCLFCEVEFFQFYQKQKLFSDIDPLLRQKGFVLYGLYPKYISTKRVNRVTGETEERLMSADAVYFKDPLSVINKSNNLSRRSLYALILSALLLNYQDFAQEIIDCYIDKKSDKKNLVILSNHLALRHKIQLEDNTKKFITECRNNNSNIFIKSKKFIDINKGNNNIDFINST